jgi:uncharacterized protein
MVLRIALALKQPGEVFYACFEEAFVPQTYGGRQIVFACPVKVSAGYSYDTKAMVLTGQIEGALSSDCALCAASFMESLSISFTERYIRGGAAGNEDAYTFEGETIELAPMVLDNLFLHLPLKSVCKADCRGLCPVCGIDRNKAACGCTQPSGKRLAPAGPVRLLGDDKEV